MMKLQTYAGFSFIAAISAIYHAFHSREQYYPAMVYLSTSKICLVLLLNMGLVIMFIMWQLVKRIFLGSLREAEVERLNEQSWREVVEILFAITIFRQDFSVGFLGMVTALLLIKALHWLAQKRVEYIETTPSVPMLLHVRIVSFMVFLFVVDCLFLTDNIKSLIRKGQASVALFFAFEYMILATTTISTFVKYVFYVIDMIMEGQWEKKAVYTFYLELIRDLLHLSMYIFFFFTIFINYGVPLHLIRELYETFRNFKIRIADYVRYRKLTSNMNERFPDATPEELDASDATCIICREEMVTAKKLLCGHLFHVHCLRSWLERQQTCPTCRALVVPPENATSISGQQHGPLAQNMQFVVGSASSSSQTPGDSGTSEDLGQHERRLQAALQAASLYERSFAHPRANTFQHSSAYQLPFLMNTAQSDNPSGQTNGLTVDAVDSALSQFHRPPFPASASDLQKSLLNVQESLIQNHIEFLKLQLQVLQQQQKLDHQTKADNEGVDFKPNSGGPLDKGKAPAASFSNSPSSDSPSDCDRHADDDKLAL